MCTLENITGNSAELGYWLNIDHTGRGIMTECASELISYAKDIMHLKKLEAYVITDHRRSILLLERLGFKK